MADGGEIRRSGLGRGLDDLLASNGVTDAAVPRDDPTEEIAPTFIPSEAKLLEFYEMMLTGRLLEARLDALFRAGRIRGVFSPAVGQEAAMVGFAGSLRSDDVFGGTHRDLMAQLARGVTLEESLLNFFGKAAGPTRGRDGSSHFGVFDKGTLMTVAALPDAYPVAVGCALAFAQKGEDRVALANCGADATSAGVWHEAVTMGSVLDLPVVFTVQNDRLGSTGSRAGEAGAGYVAHRADAYGIPGVVVDGRDVVEVAAITAEALHRARTGHGPTLIEAVISGGSEGPDEDIQHGWDADDPIPRFEEFLGTRGLLDEQRKRHLTDRIEDRIRRTVEWAQTQADPPPAQVGADVFALRIIPDVGPPEPAGEAVSFVAAVAQGLRDEMAEDERVFVIGQDLGDAGATSGVTSGLLDTFGPSRVIETPNAEGASIGAAVGAALQGMRPVVGLQSMDLIYGGLEQLVNEAAKYHWKAGRSVPIVVRGPMGAGLGSGPHASLSPESMLAHHPGIKVVIPATPYTAKGLLIGAIRDPNPVVFLEHRLLSRTLEGPVGPDAYELPLGVARIARSGDDLTIVTWGAMVHTALAAADQVAELGVGVDVVDLQTVSPIDWDTVFDSIERTSRLVVLQEDVPFASVASEVAAVAAEEMFWDLEAPIRRITPPHTHIPHAGVLEDAFVPRVEGVVEVVRQLTNS